jgi:hypothetical protein
MWVNALRNLDLVEFYDRTHVRANSVVFEGAPSCNSRSGLSRFYRPSTRAASISSSSHLLEFFLLRRGFSPLLLLNPACHDQLLNEGEKLFILYCITVRKPLLVTPRHPLLLRAFIRLPRVRALTLLMHS